jgi:hypothetical protein
MWPKVSPEAWPEAAETMAQRSASVFFFDKNGFSSLDTNGVVIDLLQMKSNNNRNENIYFRF